MKTTLLKRIFIGLLGLILTIGCSEEGAVGPIGPQGLQGEQGIQGEPGQDGTDGQDGADGEDGQDGQDGADGEDGNANVATYIFNVPNDFGSSFRIDFPELTQSVLENDAILTYLRRSDTNIGTTYFPIPGISIAYLIELELSLGVAATYFYDRRTGDSLAPPDGVFDVIKFVIISTNSTTSGKSSKESILQELKDAGVDVNDYQQVAEYFGFED